MATAPIAIAESKLATTDATLALWLFGCQACLWVLGRRPSRTAAALFWVLLEPGDPDQRPDRARLDRGLLALAWWWGWPLPGLETPALAARDLIGFALLDGPLVYHDQRRFGGRVFAIRRRPPDRRPACLRHGSARRLSRVLSGRLGAGLLPVVGPGAGRARRCLDAPQVRPAIWAFCSAGRSGRSCSWSASAPS